MIELLLVADRLLAAGELARAERVFRQVADADPRNAIAVVGLARIATLRGDHEEATNLARRALEIDPEDVDARRMVDAERVSTRPAEPAEPMRRRSLVERLKSLLRIRAADDR